jgi:hypothetical protein
VSIFAQVIGGPASPSYHGAALTADLNIGDLVLQVDDVADFDEDAATNSGVAMVALDLDAAGMIVPTSGTLLPYLTCDDTTDTITLAVPSTVAMLAGDWVYIQNPVTGLAVGDTQVMVMLDDADETGDALMVSIDTSLLAGYAYPDLTSHAVELDEDEDGQLVVRNLPGLAQALPGITPGEDEPPVTVVDTATGVVLASGVSDPIVTATATLGYPSVPLQLIAQTGSLGTFALNPTQVSAMCDSGTAGVVAIAQVVTGGTRVWYYDYTTGANVSVGGFFQDHTALRVIGMGQVGSTFRMLVQSSGALYVYQPSTVKLNAYTAVNTGQDPAFGTDGTVFLIAENDPGVATTLRVRDLGFDTVTAGNPAVPITATTVYGANSRLNGPLSYVGRGTFDFGAAKIVYAAQGASGTYVAASAAGSTRDATLFWPNGVGGRKAQCWIPGASAFFVFPGDGNLYRYTGASVADGLTQWWTGLTWKDTAGTPHETRLGPTSMVTMVNRAQLQVTIPAPPLGTGAADDVNAYGLYMTKVASGTPNSASFHLQVSAAPDPGATSSQILTAVNMGSAAPPTVNGFPTVGVSGYLASQAADASGPIIMLKGDGSGRIGQASWDVTGVWAGIRPVVSGITPVVVTTANTAASVAVTFPVGLFTVTPSVVCSWAGTAAFTSAAAPIGATTAGVNITAIRSAPATLNVNWIAHQY